MRNMERGLGGVLGIFLWGACSVNGASGCCCDMKV